MSKDYEYINAINTLITETEGKLQEVMKSNKPGNDPESLKMVLRYLREKYKELTDQQKYKN